MNTRNTTGKSLEVIIDKHISLKMTEQELQKYLKKEYPKEAEHCEWKEFKSLKHAVKGNAGDDIISYISAISNMQGGHLVIGVEDATLSIVGVQDFQNYSPENIKLKILEQCPNLSSEGFRVEPFVTDDTNKTVWVFHIPKHLPRKPVLAHNKKWQRIEDSLVEMRKEREDSILFETIPIEPDWFSAIVHDVKFSDLDQKALTKAKTEYKKNHPNLAAQVDDWPIPTFLKKARVTIDGKLTRAAILLLGTEELSVKLQPIVAKITFDSRNEKGISNPGVVAHILPPFILAADKIQELITNAIVRMMPESTPYPEKTNQYDNWVIREALHNCIAHQDYSKKQRIVVAQHPDYIIFDNTGSFIPGSVETVIELDAPQRDYRNPFLCDAMIELNMIDTAGSGIKKMFTTQQEHLFPMPDYDLSILETTRVKIYGKEINANYTYILRTRKDLHLMDIIALDKVQKGISIERSNAMKLKNLGLIEGKKPKYHIIIDHAKGNLSYSQYELNYPDFKEKFLSFLNKYGKATRVDIENIFMPLLPDNLSLEKKKKRLTNLLQKLSKEEGTIANSADSSKYPVWVLTKDRKDTKRKA